MPWTTVGPPIFELDGRVPMISRATKCDSHSPGRLGLSSCFDSSRETHDSLSMTIRWVGKAIKASVTLREVAVAKKNNFF